MALTKQLLFLLMAFGYSKGEYSQKEEICTESSLYELACESESAPVWIKHGINVQTLAIGETRARRFKDPR